MIYLAGTDFSHLTTDELIKGIKALDLPDYIRSKAYGIDVRETLAQMTEMTIQLGVNMGLSPDDALKWARKLQETVSQSEFDSWVATLLDGGPSIFVNTLSELQAKYPNGAAGVALVRETDPAKIYVWNGSAWEDFGDYQGVEVRDYGITSNKIDEGAVDISKINFDGDVYGPENLIWVSGGISPTNGAGVVKDIRARTDNYLRVSEGDSITIDADYNLNYYLYSKPTESSFISTPNSWFNNVTFNGTYYVRLQVRKRDDSVLSGQIQSINSLLTYSVSPLKIPGEAIKDGTINALKLDTDYSPNYGSQLVWEPGSIAYDTGANSTNGVSTGTRVRTSTCLKVDAGDSISIDPSYYFNYFKYTNESGGTFLGTPNQWLREATFDGSYFIRIQVRKDDESNISGQMDNITSLLSLDIEPPRLPGSFIRNGSIELTKLSPGAISSLTSNTGEPNPVDLIMFMGQSNMAGRGVTSTEWPQTAPSVKSGAGYEFRAISDPTKLYPISEPFGVNENNSTSGIAETTKTGSMVSSFTNEYFKHTRVPIVGVSASKGGTPISWWQPDGLPLQDAISRFNAAITWLGNNDYNIRNRYMVWCQGETDGDQSTTSADYKAKFLNMTGTMFDAGIDKCFIVRIGNHRDNATIYDTIIQAQTELTKEEENIILASTKFDKMATLGLMKDQFHYYQHGYNLVGAEAAQNIAFYANTGKEPTLYDWENQELYYSFK